ncbi:MAG TPA: hypothetical protein VKY44_09445, partial [Flavobacterium sp.]|nr:hypothetical protein [Flavobacterium sp.]
EKNKKRQSHQVRLAMAHFISNVAHTSTFTSLLPDYYDIFEVLMRSDEADDPEFREKAILILQFCKRFAFQLSSFDWQVAYNEAEAMKKEYEPSNTSGYEL